MIDALIDDPNETYTVFARNGSTLQKYYDPIGSGPNPENDVPVPPTLPKDPYAHALWTERVRSSNSPLGRRDVSWTPKLYWTRASLDQLRDSGRFSATRESMKPSSKSKSGQNQSKISSGKEKKAMKEVWEVLVMDNWFELDLGAEERENGYGKNERSYDEFMKGFVECLAKACGYVNESGTGDLGRVLDGARAEARRLNTEADERSRVIEEKAKDEEKQALMTLQALGG